MGRSTGCNCRCEEGCNESVIKFTEINPQYSYAPNEDVIQEVTQTGYLYKITKPFPSSYFTFSISPPLLKHQTKFLYSIFIREGSHDGPIKFKLTFSPHRFGDYLLPEYVSDYGTYEIRSNQNPVFTDWREIGFHSFMTPEEGIPDDIQSRSSRLEISNEEYSYSLYRVYNPSLILPDYNYNFMYPMQLLGFFFQITVRDSGILIHDITTNSSNRGQNNMNIFEGYQQRPYQNVLIDDINNITRSNNKIFNYPQRGVISPYSPTVVHPSGYYIKYNNSDDKMYVSYSIDFSDGEELDVTESELYNFWTVERSNIYNEIDSKNNDCVFPVIYGSNKYNYMTPLWEFVDIFDHRDHSYYEYHGFDHYYGGGSVQAYDNGLYGPPNSMAYIDKKGIVNVNYERVPSNNIFPSYNFIGGSIKKHDETKHMFSNYIPRIGVTHINQDDDTITFRFEGTLGLNVLENVHTDVIEIGYFHTINSLENDFYIGITDITNGGIWGERWVGKNGQPLRFSPEYKSYLFDFMFDLNIPRWSGEPPEISVTYSDIINGSILTSGGIDGKHILSSLNGSQLINSCYIDTMDFVTYTDEQWGNLNYRVDVKLGYNISTFNTEDLGFKLVPINTSMRHPDV